MRFDTFIATFLIAAAVGITLMSCVGCESRTFTATRPDGTEIVYRRATIFGDSSSEGVSVAKQGEDLTVDVGATNSQAKIEAALQLLEALR